MNKQKYNPKRVRVTFDTPNHGPRSLSLFEIYNIQNAARELLGIALDDDIQMKDIGICYKLYRMSNVESMTTIQIVGCISARWPHSRTPGEYSVYPVPRTKDDSLWEGKALKYRISLLRYIIKRLMDTIRRAEKNGRATIR